jgi:hypothetical protein
MNTKEAYEKVKDFLEEMDFSKHNKDAIEMNPLPIPGKTPEEKQEAIFECARINLITTIDHFDEFKDMFFDYAIEIALDNIARDFMPKLEDIKPKSAKEKEDFVKHVVEDIVKDAFNDLKDLFK